MKSKIKKAILFILILMITVSAVSCNEQTQAKESETQTEKSSWVNRVLFRDFTLFDADGDGVREDIIETEMVGATGGHGAFDLFVYTRTSEWSYSTVFTSEEYLKEHKDMDIKVSSPRSGVCAFSHEATGFYAEYTVPAEDYKYIFNEDGSLSDSHQFMVDTFNTATPKDVDGDGCEEIELRQFTSLVCHADYLGDCVTTWKLVGKEFKLIDLRIEFFEEKETQE